MFQVTDKNLNFDKMESFSYSYNGQKYTDHPDSTNDHFETSLGNIGNKVLAVGGSSTAGGTHNVEVELFDIDSNAWTTKTSFPYCRSW